MGSVYCSLSWLFLCKQTNTESLLVNHYTLLNANVYHISPIKNRPFSPWFNYPFISYWLIHMPIKAMTAYAMHVDTSSNNPVFKAGRFNPLTQKKLNRTLRNLLQQGGFNHINYSSHSFRIGATTTAAAAGLPPWLIKKLRRWHSDAYLTYLRCPDSVLSSFPLVLASTDASHQPPWDPDL